MDYSKEMVIWKDRRETIRRFKERGESIRDIASKFGISTQRVYKILNHTKVMGKAKRSNQGHRRRSKRANGAGDRKVRTS